MYEKKDDYNTGFKQHALKRNLLILLIAVLIFMVLMWGYLRYNTM